MQNLIFKLNRAFSENEEVISDRFFLGANARTTSCWLNHRPGDILKAEAQPRSKQDLPLEDIRAALEICWWSVNEEGGRIVDCYSFGNLAFFDDESYEKRPVEDNLAFATYCLWRIQSSKDGSTANAVLMHHLGHAISILKQEEAVERAIVKFLGRKLREDYRSETPCWVSKRDARPHFFNLQAFCVDVCAFLISISGYAEEYDWSLVGGFRPLAFADERLLSMIWIQK